MKNKKIEIRKIIGEELRKARLDKGLTLQECASKAGLSHVSIVHYEAGTRSINFDDMALYCEACGFDFDEISKAVVRKVSSL